MNASWYALVLLSTIGAVSTLGLIVVVVSLLLDRRRHRIANHQRGAVRR